MAPLSRKEQSSKDSYRDRKGGRRRQTGHHQHPITKMRDTRQGDIRLRFSIGQILKNAQFSLDNSMDSHWSLHCATEVLHFLNSLLVKQKMQR